MLTHTLNPSTGEQRQLDFEMSLVYRVSSRTAKFRQLRILTKNRKMVSM